MSKLLFTTDLHLTGKNPSSRLDNYLDSWFEKFNEFLDIGKSEGCEFLLNGGDLNDVPILSNVIVDRLLDAVESNGIPIINTWGNHCLSGANIKTSESSSLAHMLRRSKLMLTSGSGDNYDICVRHYFHNIEEDIKANGIFCDKDKPYKIAMVHAMITDKPLPANALYVLPNEIITNCDLILCGHNHTPFEVTIANHTYLNVGCFGRTAINEFDIKPSVVLIDTDKRTYKVIKLKSAKSGKKIFDLTKKEEEKNTRVSLDSFVEAIKNTKAQSLDIRGNVEYFSKQGNIDREITDLIINKIGEVENGN